ncbi:fumarylacetoacetate hydrolase family protein [Embleya sp. NBC_00896]|uniref:fumarylacetoacetate hydrolase family protein n=1 Tax=Embleya sp. NBC_00896 TaxID=2975961 RepID=UPI00386E8E80|nr:fumarylacetoacetate hydrolase family protein [Embleya sp. NBC_00896]
MKFATFDLHGSTRSGVVSGDVVHPLPEGGTLLDLIERGDAALRSAGEAALAGPAVALADVRLLAPLRPPTVRDFVAFEEHVEGVAVTVQGPGAGVVPEWYELPTFYFTNPYAIIGPNDDVPVPPGSTVLDFELEVGIVIGKPGRDLTVEQAAEHIVGYTIFNDWSARDLQSREMKVGLGPCKGKDTATTLGPWLVTADEFERYRDSDGFLDIAMRASINGIEVGRDSLVNMGWPPAELVAYASRGTWVRPGDVLGTGTCGNGGCLGELWGLGRELPPLKPGDTVALTVEGIGTLTNTVVEGATPRPIPPARTRPRTRKDTFVG